MPTLNWLTREAVAGLGSRIMRSASGLDKLDRT
jgi:hypothetical protein